MILTRNPKGPRRFVSHGVTWDEKHPQHDVPEKAAREILASAPKIAFLPPARSAKAVTEPPDEPVDVESSAATESEAANAVIEPPDEPVAVEPSASTVPEAANAKPPGQDAVAEAPKVAKVLAKPGQSSAKPQAKPPAKPDPKPTPKPAPKPNTNAKRDEDDDDPLLAHRDKPGPGTMTTADMPSSALRR